MNSNSVLLYNSTGKYNNAFDFLEDSLSRPVNKISSLNELDHQEDKYYGLVVILGTGEGVSQSIFQDVFRVIRVYRSEKRYYHIPLVFLAFKGSTILRTQALAAGVNVYEELPLKRKDLVTLLQNQLTLHDEVQAMSDEVSRLTYIKELTQDMAKKREALLIRDIENMRKDIEKQNIAQEAMFDLSRQELLALNERLKHQYEAEIRALKEKSYIESMFGKYVSPEIVDRVIDPQKSKDLRGLKKEITIFFADLRGFTKMSEKLSPEKTIFILNEFFTEMTEIIHREGGWVDKYTGDNIMALFGAPLDTEQHSCKAVKASVLIHQLFRKVRREWHHFFDVKVGLGIGLATGEVVVGNVGSFQKIAYTAIGDTVNIASRLENIAPDGFLYLNDTCYNHLTEEERNEFAIEFYKKESVKGKELPVSVYITSIYTIPGLDAENLVIGAEISQT